MKAAQVFKVLIEHKVEFECWPAGRAGLVTFRIKTKHLKQELLSDLNGATVMFDQDGAMILSEGQ